MSIPANLSELMFQVINITDGLDSKPTSIVMVTGKDTEGNLRLWVDEFSAYYTEHPNLDVREALREMVGKETPFLEANEYILSEWTEEDGSWGRSDTEGTLL